MMVSGDIGCKISFAIGSFAFFAVVRSDFVIVNTKTAFVNDSLAEPLMS